MWDDYFTERILVDVARPKLRLFGQQKTDFSIELRGRLVLLMGAPNPTQTGAWASSEARR
jgi:hypothetical protein